MSTFVVPIVLVEKLEKHPNADSLSITEAEGCPCIIRTGDLEVGQLAVYIPVESVIKQDSPAGKALSFLKFKNGKHRVKASKLRGIFSMGVLMPASAFYEGQELPPEALVGFDMASLLEIEKYEEPEDLFQGGKYPQPGTGYSNRFTDCDRDPGLMPKYDMESYRKYKDIFYDDDGAPLEVVVTEKIHGTNGRFIYDGERLWVGSHRTWRRNESVNHWTNMAKALDLETKLAPYPHMGVFVEIYGDVQDLKYGASQQEVRLAVFDVFDSKNHRYLNFDDKLEFCEKIGLPLVPILYRGPINVAIVESLAEGMTTLGGGNIKEGIVITTAVERWHRRVGRTIAKLVSEQYLLRPGGSERH